MTVFEKKTGRFCLRMTLECMGRDLCVTLAGGDAPHIGAVALAVPHPGLRTPEKTDASVSILTVTGHKEDRLAGKVAHTIATAANCTVSVSCGIHLDEATDQEITDILNAAETLLDEVLCSFT